MIGKVSLLIVSSRLERKRKLLRILNGLPLRVYFAASLAQAEEALNQQRIHAVLCEEDISDGTYQDVLALTAFRLPRIQFILLLTLGRPGEYPEAGELGVSEVVPRRFGPIDIELALIHAVRGETPLAHAAW